jgi:DNA-binding NarL/FixJ family response regulator
MTKRVLIVDDDPMLLQLLSLEFEQYENVIDVMTVQGGIEAIEAIEARKPDVIVLDLRMTKGDGFSVLEHLKKADHKISIIVLTNYNRADYREKCTDLGVHEYMVKSDMRFAQLKAKVEALAMA